MPALRAWAESLGGELREKLSALLPLRNNEREFIVQIREKGQIQPELISSNLTLVEKIKSHPALLWVAQQDG